MIREAGLDEIYLVAVMAKNFENHTKHVKVDPKYTTESYQRMIALGEGVIFVLEEDGIIVGGIGGAKIPDLHWPRVIAIETFWFILPEHRGPGIKLKDRFEKWALDEGCSGVDMVHLVDSHPDILEKLYERDGYSLVEKHYLKVFP